MKTTITDGKIDLTELDLEDVQVMKRAMILFKRKMNLSKVQKDHVSSMIIRLDMIVDKYSKTRENEKLHIEPTFS